MSGAITPLPYTPSWRGDQLKYRDSFTSYLLSQHLPVGTEENNENSNNNGFRTEIRSQNLPNMRQEC
jgi:hypothetical protein